MVYLPLLEIHSFQRINYLFIGRNICEILGCWDNLHEAKEEEEVKLGRLELIWFASDVPRERIVSSLNSNLGPHS